MSTTRRQTNLTRSRGRWPDFWWFALAGSSSRSSRSAAERLPLARRRHGSHPSLPAGWGAASIPRQTESWGSSGGSTRRGRWNLKPCSAKMMSCLPASCPSWSTDGTRSLTAFRKALGLERPSTWCRPLARLPTGSCSASTRDSSSSGMPLIAEAVLSCQMCAGGRGPYAAHGAPKAPIGPRPRRRESAHIPKKLELAADSRLAPPAGIEPATHGLGNRRSIH